MGNVNKKPGNTRKTGAEQFYTPRSLAQRLTEMLVSWGAPIDSTWLEPAAGTGAFIKGMRRCGIENIVAYDIEPKTPLAKAQDFLSVDLSQLSGVVCLTNPPFGRNHSLSVPFFNKVAPHADLIGFVVPRSWRKWSVINRLDNKMFKVVDIEIAINYVDDLENPISKAGILNTVFQVWERRDDVVRARHEYSGPKYFSVTKPNLANTALTVFGRDAGRVERGKGFAPNTTKMFMDTSGRVAWALSEVDLSCFYTQVAFTEALGASEIRSALHNFFEKGTSFPHDHLRTESLSRSLRLQVPQEIKRGTVVEA